MNETSKELGSIISVRFIREDTDKMEVEGDQGSSDYDNKNKNTSKNGYKEVYERESDYLRYEYKIINKGVREEGVGEGGDDEEENMQSDESSSSLSNLLHHETNSIYLKPTVGNELNEIQIMENDSQSDNEVELRTARDVYK